MRALLHLFLASAVFTPTVRSQSVDPHATVTVGSASAKRGERAYGALAIPAGSDSGTTIQLAIINGARPGPVVAFVSGAHGTEYTSIVALTRLIERIDPGKLTGTVIVVPLLNVASFEQMVPHVNPVDRKGMNASYPGDANGTQTVARKYWSGKTQTVICDLPSARWIPNLVARKTFSRRPWIARPTSSSFLCGP